MEAKSGFGADGGAGFGGHERGAKRDSMFLQANVRRIADGEQFQVRARNLSAGGMMAEAPALFARGDRLLVSIRGIEDVVATVAWVESGRMGLAFETAIDPAAARRAKLQSAGSSMTLVRASSEARRPPLRVK